MATEDELLLFHTTSHIRTVRTLSERGAGLLDAGDTPAFKGVFEAASYVVGTTLECLMATMEGGCYAFNPMGGLHHARRDRSAGFCVFNDVGVAIERARNHHNIRRILYIDIDAHHGDGVMYEYYDDKDLLVADFHEDARYLYPGTGFEYETGGTNALGSKRNVMLPPGAVDEEFERELEAMSDFLRGSKAELVILQAGADCLEGDPIAGLSLSKNAHRMVSEVAREVADDSASGRLLALGGGGYAPTNVAEAWVSVLKALLAR